MELATFAGGCFWCTEAIFERLRGVLKVESGYTSGDKEDPSYEEVSSGTTGHAEANQITFDPKIISYKNLLEIFFKLHDPTTINRQGSDIGEQYRSAIFYHSDEQKKTAEFLKSKIPGVVTEILPSGKFYIAEAYHQDYYNQNNSAPYCKLVIDPKIQKLYKEFKEFTK
ncbi:MAG: peptide-methionine (S)-S-oxide reductase MsrA [Patescibacteria group bacterium]